MMPMYVTLVVTGALVFAGGARGAPTHPIYFFANVGEPINKQNPLTIRPRGLLLFQDAQWVLQRLRWTGSGADGSPGGDMHPDASCGSPTDTATLTRVFPLLGRP